MTYPQQTEAATNKPAQTSESQQPDWAQKTLEKVALAAVVEQRRARRWGIFFKFLFIVYLLLVSLIVFGGKHSAKSSVDALGNPLLGLAEQSEHIALIKLDGVIASDKEGNALSLMKSLNEALQDDSVTGVILLANSPGGSPVQSSMVYEAIARFKAKYHKPIYTLITDTCASGCYYIVSGTDKIYADASSIVGSIGVISQFYGYEEAAKKLGIEPRTYTAGDNKDFMNPTREPRPDEVAFLKEMLDAIHQQFIESVKKGRGDKLADDPRLFSGLFWTGKQAQSLGLIDGLRSIDEVAKEMGDYPVIEYNKEELLEKMLRNFAVQSGFNFGSAVKNAVTGSEEANYQLWLK